MPLDTQPTPGPYRVDNGLIRSPHGVIAGVVYECGAEAIITHEQSRANARLLAASWEIYDALAAAMSAFEDEEESVKDEHRKLMVKMQAALDKAKP